MNERGWVEINLINNEEFASAPAVMNGTYVLMDTSIKQGEVVLRETRGGLYSYNSKILSDDIKVRLLGEKMTETFKFEKEIPIARTATQVQNNKVTVIIKINGIYKKAKKATLSNSEFPIDTSSQ